MRYIIFLAICLSMLACQPSSKQEGVVPNTRFTSLSAQYTGIDFKNEVENTDKFNIFSYRNFYNGGGVGIGDVNNDGLPDVYFTKNMGSNKLYLNKGNLQFEDITQQAGVSSASKWSTGVVMVDINADGLLDIYVCNAGYLQGEDQRNQLYINNGDLSFSEKAAEYGLNQNGYTTHAAFFDYDLDGDLDAYILNNSFMPVNTLNYSNKRELYAEDWPVRDFLKGGGDKLLRNDGGQYKDVTKEAGIYGSLIGFGLGVTVGDINGDMLPDLYISNDFYERDYLYINQGDGRFSEKIRDYMDHISQFSMGADMADVNNDGHPEIFVTDMMPYQDRRLKETTVFESYKLHREKLRRDFYHQYMHNSLQLNRADGTFTEIAQFSGVEASDWSWGALMFDADNDGYRDIYICNGILQDVTNQDFVDFFANDVVQKMVLTGKKEEMQNVIEKMPSEPLINRFFHNKGDLTFEDKSKAWGLETPSFSNGAAYGDLDNDGDLDLLVNNLDREAFVFRNNTQELEPRHYLGLKLRGDAPNTFAIGTRVQLYAEGEILNVQHIPSRGFQSSVDHEILMGLGERNKIDSLVLTWPDRSMTTLLDLPLDTVLELHPGKLSKRSFSYTKEKSEDVLLKEVKHDLGPHVEDDYDDFAEEGLLIRKMSHEGPVAALGDIYGRGQQYLYLGGGAGQAGRLYRIVNGEFKEINVSSFKEDAEFEDTAGSWVDIDGDGDLDLILGSGGNHQPLGSPMMQDRVYENLGKERFRKKEKALSVNGFNTSVILALDHDGDGDQDLWVGSRSVPGSYGKIPRSFVYENDGKGNFKDIASKGFKDWQYAGMITDALTIDLDGDEQKEVVVVGEWMAPLVLGKGKEGWEARASALEDYAGWYYAVETDDVDGDGDPDLILGNRGENFYFSGSQSSPAKLWVHDFDFNGKADPIITRHVDGKDKPIAMKKALTEQIVSLKKQNLKHSEYATKSIQELFSDKILDQSQVLEGKFFSSAVAINQGDGMFEPPLPLPTEVQLSCVCDIHCSDVDGDGKKDLLLAGNFSQFLPQFSKLDGSRGHLLINQGGGNYKPLPARKTGFEIRGDVKQLMGIELGGRPHVLVLVNDEAPGLFEMKIKRPQ